jgi:signal transduction histidine kinase
VSVLYTTVPYTWRRHLSIVRVALAIAALLLYIIRPLPYAYFFAGLISAYAAFAFYALLRSGAEPLAYSLLLLGLDAAFFCICALHPSAFGMWLAIVAYFHVLLLATLLHTWRNVALVVASSTVILAAIATPVRTYLWPALLLGGVLAIILTIYKEHVHERLSAALRRSVMSRSEAEIAREHERQRIAADFHDGPLQSFISFQMRLEIIRKLLTRDAESAMREVLQLQDLGRAQVTELRAFVRGMQPVEITPQTLGSAIREAVEHFERDSGISAQLFCGDLSSVADSVAPEVLQIVREALNNVRKHSKASRVSIVVEAGERDVEIAVEDDGSGFPFSGAYSLDELEVLRLGPRSIKRRVRTLGGDLTLDSRPSAGATIRVRIPGNR